MKPNGLTGVVLGVFHRQVDAAVGSCVRVASSLHADDVGTSYKQVKVEMVNRVKTGHFHFRTILRPQNASALEGLQVVRAFMRLRDLRTFMGLHVHV